MSTTYLCDICGETCDGSNACGFDREFHYCSKHWPNIKEYFTARDAAQERLQKQWKNTLEKLRRDFQKKHPKGKLPDALG